MRNRNNTWACLLILVVLLVGCARVPAPWGWLPDASETSLQAYGGWIELDKKMPNDAHLTMNGELIAVATDTIYVLVEKTMHSVAAQDITKARLVTYDSNYGNMVGLVVLGTLATLSHGLYFLLSAPIWIIAGSMTTGFHSHRPIIDFPKHPLKNFAAYARFPQGLPGNFKRESITAKAYTAPKPRHQKRK